jgi:hypothetical protein
VREPGSCVVQVGQTDGQLGPRSRAGLVDAGDSDCDWQMVGESVRIDQLAHSAERGLALDRHQRRRGRRVVDEETVSGFTDAQHAGLSAGVHSGYHRGKLVNLFRRADDQDHLVDPPSRWNRLGVDHGGTIIKGLVSCADRVLRATTAVDDAKDSSSEVSSWR